MTCVPEKFNDPLDEVTCVAEVLEDEEEEEEEEEEDEVDAAWCRGLFRDGSSCCSSSLSFLSFLVFLVFFCCFFGEAADFGGGADVTLSAAAGAAESARIGTASTASTEATRREKRIFFNPVVSKSRFFNSAFSCLTVIFFTLPTSSITFFSLFPEEALLRFTGIAY